MSYLIELESTSLFSVFKISPSTLPPLVAIIPNDANLEEEANAACDAGFKVHRFSVLSRSTAHISPDDIYPAISGPCRAIHRGFMLTDEVYSILSREIHEKLSVSLIVSPLEYARAHYFPSNYSYLSLYSPRAVWCPCSSDSVLSNSTFESAAAIVQSWGCAYVLLKDYVKSAKDITSKFTKASTANSAEMCELACQLVEARGSRFNKGSLQRTF
jgi:hypothetical protein